MKRRFFLLVAALVPVICPVEGRSRLRVDDRLPAGNVVVDKVSADTVYLRPDLRDTGREWFYWAFRVRGAQGRTVVFKFNGKWVGARGPVVSTDRGKSFRYSGGEASDAFTYTFGPRERAVYFYECHPYLPRDWKRFLRGLDRRTFRAGELCRSRSGKKVPFATFGRLDGRARHSVVITARHHCSESIASFVLEGIVSVFAGDSEAGKWLRENVGLSVVPFVDYDGVVAGDQGKARLPHDHNRDYKEFLYPETRAVADLCADRQPEIFLDLHCPWISGPNAELVYCPMGNPATEPDWAAETLFTEIVSKNARGLPYSAGNNLPFGVRWNTGKNLDGGLSSRRWAVLNLSGIRICRCFETPFANAQGVEVNPVSAREFGESIAESIVDFLKEK